MCLSCVCRFLSIGINSWVVEKIPQQKGKPFLHICAVSSLTNALVEVMVKFALDKIYEELLQTSVPTK